VWQIGQAPRLGNSLRPPVCPCKRRIDGRIFRADDGKADLIATVSHGHHLRTRGLQRLAHGVGQLAIDLIRPARPQPRIQAAQVGDVGLDVVGAFACLGNVRHDPLHERDALLGTVEACHRVAGVRRKGSLQFGHGLRVEPAALGNGGQTRALLVPSKRLRIGHSHDRCEIGADDCLRRCRGLIASG
jgi:hypothetical protein